MTRSRISSVPVIAVGALMLPFVAGIPTANASSTAGGPGSQLARYAPCICDYSGASVATSGTLALVGVPGIDDAAGRVYVYSDTSGTWTQTAELKGSDTGAGDTFGDSVALSGTTAVIGAQGHGSYSGSAYIFDEQGGTWTQTAELQASEAAPGDWFGVSVATDGSTAIVGAPAHANSAGSAYVFSVGAKGWTQQAELNGVVAKGDFGYSVAVSGTTAMVGAPAVPVDHGNVYVYSDTAGAWSQTAELAGTGGGVHDFGTGVAIEGDTAVVGAWLGTGGASYVFTRRAGAWTEDTQLHASDHRIGFGAAVAISGTTVAVSAVGSSGNSGRVYVFSDTTGTWTQTAELAPSGLEQGDFFGNRALAISGTTIAVGAPAHGTAGDAFMFTETAGAWNQVADLSSSDTNSSNGTGTAVAISSAAVIAGAPGHDGAGRGYIFPTPPPYHPVIGLQGSNTTAGDEYGASLAVSDTTVLAGAPGHTGGGTAYVSAETVGNIPNTQAAVRAPANAYFYEQPVELKGSDTAPGDGFATSVGISGTTAVVGAPGHGGAGRVYVFSDAAGPWTQVAELTASGLAAGNAFGTSVAISGTTVVVGAPGRDGPGKAFVFADTAGTWNQVAQLAGTDSASGDHFGTSVSISGATAVVGAPGHAGAGRGYVFSGPSGTWSQVAELVGSDTAAGDGFGSSVAISGTGAIVGAPGHSAGGRGYLFSAPSGTWAQTAELVGSDTALGDRFGTSVAISGPTAAVGAPGSNNGVGATYKFNT